MNNLVYIALGIVGTLYVKDKEFRKEVNKTVSNVINELKEIK